MLQPPYPVSPLTQHKTPIIFAHQGASKQCPPNTKPAFDLAQAQGAALECDVHSSSDGVPVIIHDATLESTTNGHGPVNAHTWAQLSRLDAGFHFAGNDGNKSWRGRGVRIPKLEDVLATFSQTLLNVDIKQVRPCIVGAVVGLAEAAYARHRLAGRTGPLPLILTSESSEVKRKLEAAQPPCHLGLCRQEVYRLLLHAYLRYPLPRALRWPLPDSLSRRALQMPTHAKGWPLLTAPVREACQAAQISIDLWEIDDVAEARHWIDQGATGIFTNVPDVIHAGTCPASST